MKTRLHILVALLVGMLLGACDAVLPQDTAETTAEMTPADALALTSAYSGTDVLGGTITVRYPDGWTQGGDGNGLFLSNNAALIESDLQQALQSGDAVALISPLPDPLLQSLVEGDAELTPELVLEEFAQTLAEAPNSLELSEIESYQINGRPLAEATGSSEQGDTLTIVVDEGDAFVQIIGITSSGEGAAFQRTFEALAGDVQYTPGSNPATGETEIQGDTDEILGETVPEVTAEATADN